MRHLEPLWYFTYDMLQSQQDPDYNNLQLMTGVISTFCDL